MLAAEMRASEVERQVQAAKERTRATEEQRKKSKRHCDAQFIRGVGRVLACARRRDHGGGHALRLLS